MEKGAQEELFQHTEIDEEEVDAAKQFLLELLSGRNIETMEVITQCAMEGYSSRAAHAAFVELNGKEIITDCCVKMWCIESGETK